MGEKLEPIELREFVAESVREIETGAGDRWISGDIEFEVVITRTTKIDGKVKLYVASVGADTSEERLQRVKFKVHAKTPEKRHGKPTTHAEVSGGASDYMSG